MNHLQHYEINAATFDTWIRTGERLEISNDIFKPLIEPFKEANPGVNIHNCPECLTDMLRWVKMEWKKANPAQLTEGFVKECKTSKPKGKKNA